MQPMDTKGATTIRQGFAEKSIEKRAETAATAVAAQAQAAVQARYVMALQRPRDMDDFRTRLLKECVRPGFADAAIYHKPVGKGIEGPSIRLAEACVRLMGNVLVESPTVYDDEMKRIVRVSATDLETNTTFQGDIVLEKTVERSDKAGHTVLGERTNKNGKAVYIVQATEDDLLNKVNALVSKAVRTNGLRLVPADILEEAMSTCRATMKQADAKDPGAARKKLVDAWATLGVTAAELKDYLGHDLDQLNEEERNKLRGLYCAIKDGDTSWSAARGEKANGGTTAPVAPSKAPAAPSVAQAPKTNGGTPVADAPVSRPPAASEPQVESAPKEPAPIRISEDAVFEDVKEDELRAVENKPLKPEPEDPLSAEIRALEQAIDAAQDRAVCQKLTPRVRAIPGQEGLNLQVRFTAKMKSFK